MAKGRFLRLIAGVVLLAVLFTQVGLNLLHGHKGLPERHSAALSNGPETGGSICQVCALDGIPGGLYVEVPLLFFSECVSAVTYDAIVAGDPLPAPHFGIGRAPPVC